VTGWVSGKQLFNRSRSGAEYERTVAIGQETTFRRQSKLFKNENGFQAGCGSTLCAVFDSDGAISVAITSIRFCAVASGLILDKAQSLSPLSNAHSNAGI
jgi:hypothetical protein